MKRNLISIRQEAKRYKVSHSRVQKLTENILRYLSVSAAELDILLVSDSAIRKINRKLLKHDWATDVISIGEKGTVPKRGLSPKLIQGNLVISLDTTTRQAKEYGNDFFYELMFYICHGILHILGWEDNTVVKRKRMLENQTKILKVIGVSSRQ